MVYKYDRRLCLHVCHSRRHYLLMCTVMPLLLQEMGHVTSAHLGLPNLLLKCVLGAVEVNVGGSFSDNFNFSMEKASRAYNFCFISKRHVVFNWQSFGHIKTKLNAQRYKKKIETSLFFGSLNVLIFYRHDLLF